MINPHIKLSVNTRRPARGEVWWIQLDPAKIHATVITRPCVVLSADQINLSAANIVIVVPIEFEDQGIASHIRIDPKDVDIKKTGFIHCEDIRLVPLHQVQSSIGRIPDHKMHEIEETVSFLLGLS